MDSPHDVRRKRLKRFDPMNEGGENLTSPSTGQGSTLTSGQPYLNTQQQQHHHHHAPQSFHHPIGYTAGMDASQHARPDISEDEKYARQLQAEIEASERPQTSKALPGLPSYDFDVNEPKEAELDDQLFDDHFGFPLAYSSGFSENASKDDACRDMPDLWQQMTDSERMAQDTPDFWQQMTDDEKMAREMQARFDFEAQNGIDGQPPTRSHSPSPPSTVKLPPTPPNMTGATQNLDHSDDATAAHGFASTIINVRCAVCGSVINLSAKKLAALFAALCNNDKQDFIFYVKCHACQNKTCPGCATPVINANMQYGQTASNGKHLMWHCDGARLGLIWLLLCGFDHTADHNKVKTTQPSAKQQGREAVAGRGGRYGAKKVAGVGYSNDYDSMKSYYEEYDSEEESGAASVNPAVLSKSAQAKPPSTYSPHTYFPPTTLGTSNVPAPPPFSNNVAGPPGFGYYTPTPAGLPYQPTTSGWPHPPAYPSPSILPGAYKMAAAGFPAAGSPAGFMQPTYPPPHQQPKYAAPTLPYFQHPTHHQLPKTATPLPHQPYYPKYNFPPRKNRNKGKVRVKDAPVDPDDATTTNVLPLLVALLPSITGQLVPTDFDGNPPPILSSMFKRSSILDRAAALLRNDSIDNITQRCQLYNNLIAFIRILLDGGPLMAAIVHEDRRINKAGHDLLKVSFSMPTRQAGEKIETGTSLASCMENLAVQSKAMLRLSATNANGDSDDEQKMLLLCTWISECADLIAQQASMYQRKPKEISTTETNTDEWQKDLKVVEVADEIILEQHCFAHAARALVSSQQPRGRVTRISREMVSMSTSLPPGIFIRHGESRADVMKVVIIGPKDTPYENAMFEFDVFCTAKYPQEPPNMQLKTTGGGTVGFNPNLYHTGKVCLSLLGTWSGEQWIPNKSTLLQVFVSIQAMIFCSDPWNNEPGVRPDKVKEYNRQLYPNVVKYGMLEWIEGKRTKPLGNASLKGAGRRLGTIGDETRNAQTFGADIWSEVARKHFEANRDEIVKTVTAWSKDVPDGPKKKSTSTKKSKTKWSVNPWGLPGANLATTYGYPSGTFMGQGHTLGDGSGMPAPRKSDGPSGFAEAKATIAGLDMTTLDGKKKGVGMQDVTKAEDGKVISTPGLIIKLKGMLPTLQDNAKHYGTHPDSFDYDEEDYDSYSDEEAMYGPGTQHY